MLARIPGLGRSLWYDELFTLQFFATSPIEALTRQIAANNHPPASLVAWVVRHLPGGELGLHLPFALAGALAVAALAWALVGAIHQEGGPGLAPRDGRRAAFVVAGLAILLPAHVLASQQVRGYAFMLLAGSVALGAFLRVVHACDGAPQQQRAALLTAVALATWSHPTFFAAALGLVGVALLAPRLGAAPKSAREAALATCTGAFAGALLLAPVLGRSWKFVRANLNSGPAAGLSPGAMGPAELADGVVGHPLLAALLLGLAAVGAVRLARLPRTRLLAAALLAAPAVLLVVLALRPLGYGRFALFALPSLLALAACGLLTLTRGRRLRTALLLLPLLAGAALVTGANAGRELQDLRRASAVAADRANQLGGAPVIGLGPGGEVLGPYAPGSGADPTGEVVQALVADGRHVVCVVPLPGWLEEQDELRAVLFSDAFADPWIFPGREHPVAVFATLTPYK